MFKKSILQLSLYGQSKPPSNGTKGVVFEGLLLRAVKDFQEGNNLSYNNTIGQISDSTAKSSQMLEWFKEGVSIAFMLEKKFKKLVEALLHVRWMEREKDVLETFRDFIIALVTSNPVHMRLVMFTLGKALTPVNLQAGKKFDCRTSDEQVHKVVREIFQTINRLIPQSNNLLVEVLKQSFPYIKKPVEVVKCYVENLLVLADNQPSLRLHLLGLIIQKLLILDAHAPRDKIEEESDDEDEDEEEEEDEKDEENGSTKGEEDEDKMKYVLADSLDQLMVVVFNYIHKCSHPNGEYDKEASRKFFRQVLRIFGEFVLPLHGIAHVQFIVFYMCKLDESYALQFLECLWQRVTNVSLSNHERRACTCYIASFLARANYLPKKVVLSYLKKMSDWAKKYLKESLASSGGSHYLECNIVKHGTFYNVCQTLFYVTVHRHNDILEYPAGYGFLRGLDFQHLIISHLNPLRACLPIVVSKFSYYMRIHQIVYCESIVQRNNRQMLPVVGAVTNELASTNPLDCFFPFDPYILKRSFKFVEPLYQIWRELKVVNDKEDEEKKDDSVEKDGDDEDYDIEMMEINDEDLMTAVDNISNGIFAAV